MWLLQPWCLTIVYIKFTFDFISLEPFEPDVFNLSGMIHRYIFLAITPQLGCMWNWLLHFSSDFQMSPRFLLKDYLKLMSWLYFSSSECQVVVLKYWFKKKIILEYLGINWQLKVSRLRVGIICLGTCCCKFLRWWAVRVLS